MIAAESDTQYEDPLLMRTTLMKKLADNGALAWKLFLCAPPGTKDVPQTHRNDQLTLQPIKFRRKDRERRTGTVATSTETGDERREHGTPGTKAVVTGASQQCQV